MNSRVWDLVFFPRNFVSCDNKKKAGLAKFLFEDSSDSTSVVLITIIHVCFIVTAICCRLFMGCTNLLYTQHSPSFSPR